MPPHNPFKRSHEALTVFITSIIEPERLFVKIPEKVKWFNADVSTPEAAFEQAPKILHAVRVDFAFGVALGMVNRFVDVIALQTIIRTKGIGEYLGAGLDMLPDFALNRCAFGVWDVFEPHLASGGVPLQKTHDDGFSGPAVPRPRFRFCLAFILRAIPPMYVSSASTSPDIFSNEPELRASRILWLRNQAVFWVIPSARCNSHELIPFFALDMSQNAASHLSKGRGLPSMIVPTLTENWSRSGQSSHVQTRRLAVNERWVEPHFGHFATPSVHRIDTMNLKATSGSEK